MTNRSIGDQVVCHIANSNIVSIYIDEWDSKYIFDIISLYDNGYIIYIPSSIIIKSYIEIMTSNYKRYNLHQKFIGSTVCQISEDHIASVFSKVDGMHCSICKDFISMAEANQSDGSLICWGCNNYRSYR